MKSPNKSSLPSRRVFIKEAATAAFGFTFVPAYLTSARAAGNPLLPPSRRINLGCIGVGGRAKGVIPALCRAGSAWPIAFADVDYVTALLGGPAPRQEWAHYYKMA